MYRFRLSATSCGTDARTPQRSEDASLTCDNARPKWPHSLILQCPVHHTATSQGGAIAQLGERVVRNDEVGGSIPPGSTNHRK